MNDALNVNNALNVVLGAEREKTSRKAIGMVKSMSSLMSRPLAGVTVSCGNGLSKTIDFSEQEEREGRARLTSLNVPAERTALALAGGLLMRAAVPKPAPGLRTCVNMPELGEGSRCLLKRGRDDTEVHARCLVTWRTTSRLGPWASPGTQLPSKSWLRSPDFYLRTQFLLHSSHF